MNAHRCAFFLSVFLVSCGSPSDAPHEDVDPPITASDRIIVQCRSDCAATENDLRPLGAKITNRFQNIAALAVTLPQDN